MLVVDTKCEFNSNHWDNKHYIIISHLNRKHQPCIQNTMQLHAFQRMPQFVWIYCFESSQRKIRSAARFAAVMWQTRKLVQCPLRMLIVSDGWYDMVYQKRPKAKQAFYVQFWNFQCFIYYFRSLWPTFTANRIHSSWFWFRRRMFLSKGFRGWISRMLSRMCQWRPYICRHINF